MSKLTMKPFDFDEAERAFRDIAAATGMDVSMVKGEYACQYTADAKKDFISGARWHHSVTVARWREGQE